MKTIEIIIIIVMTLVGFGILVLVMGLETAFFMAGAVIGCWLLFTGLGIIGDLLKRKADETLRHHQARDTGKTYTEMAYAAREHKEFIENGRKEIVEI